MRIIIQQVSHASVRVDTLVTGEIERGIVVFLGIHKNDTEVDSDRIIQKILDARIFPDDTQGALFDQSIGNKQYGILVVSQFTLYGSLKKGRRPSFDQAATPNEAKKIYDLFVKKLKQVYSGRVETGIFQAHMEVSLTNDGPVTFIYDTHVDL